MSSFTRIVAAAALTLVCTPASAYQISGRFLVEGGGFGSTSGQTQNVYITGLAGDKFNVTNHHDDNSVFGVGYLIDGWRKDRYGVDYGINAFYLAKTKVSGNIKQEFEFTNLAYRYYVSHLPVYAFVKGFVNTNYNNLVVTADAGVGPNFMNTNLYQDTSLDGVTVPDNAYPGNFTNTVFSAMAGFGLKVMMGEIPVELGYRFFYLGEGSFNPRTNQILTKLQTGNNTAQAMILTVSIT